MFDAEGIWLQCQIPMDEAGVGIFPVVQPYQSTNGVWSLITVKETPHK